MKKGFYKPAAVFMAVLLVAGCRQSEKSRTAALPDDTNLAVGNMAEFVEAQAVEVTGFGLVGGLGGTGSENCPPQLREQMIKYIWQRLPDTTATTPEKLLKSKDTTVVEVSGQIPSLASKGDRFDLKVWVFPNTQATSLGLGRLYTCELKEKSRLLSFDQFARTIATGQGPLFIDRTGNKPASLLEAYIPGGGIVSEDVKIYLQLIKPDYITASTIRNRIDQRFGPATATALSEARIQLNIPKSYENQKELFLNIVSAIFLTTSDRLQQERIESLTEKIARDREKLSAEVALCAIGSAAVEKLKPLLTHKDQAVRFHAARCILNTGDNGSIETLRQIINDSKSIYRIAAIRAVGNYARRTDATTILRPVLNDTDFDTRFAAYEQLLRLDDASISSKFVAGDFFVDTVFCGGPKVIYLGRSGPPRIILFGSPIYCRKDVFVSTDDKSVVINAKADDKLVTIMRKHPKRPKIVGPIKSTFELSGIIRSMCEDVDIKDKPVLSAGLEVPYYQAAEVLEKMAKTGAVAAEFRAGPMPQLPEEQAVSTPEKPKAPAKEKTKPQEKTKPEEQAVSTPEKSKTPAKEKTKP